VLGSDTATLKIAGDLTVAKGAITNVETINFVSSADVTVEFQNAAGTTTRISGVENIVNLGSTDDVSATNVSELAKVVVNGAAASKDTDIEFVDALLAGSADSVTLEVVGLGAHNIKIGSQSDDDGDYETLVVKATGVASDLGASNNTFGVDAATVDVDADVALDFGTTARFAAATAIDASGSTGAVTITLADDSVTGSTTAKTLTGGSGNDTFDIDALTESKVGVVTLNGGAGDDTFDMGDFADTTMVLNGGAGTDTLQFTAALTASEGATATSIERIMLDGDISQDMSVFSNTTPTIIKADGDVTITRAGAEITTLELNDGFDASASFARTSDPAAGSLILDVKQTVSATALTAAQEETITVDADTAAITLATGITATDLTTFVASGDNAVDLSVVTNTLVSSVDVSGMTNADFEASFTGSTVALTVTSNTSTTNTGSLIITSGAGADTLNGTVTGDTLVGGLGADTIRGRDNATGDTETLTGGGGIDTFVFESTAALNGVDTITDFTAGTGGDKLDVSAFADGFTVDITGYTTTSNSDVDIASKVVLLEGEGATSAKVVAEIQGAANAFNLASGGKAVVIGDDGTHSYVWFVDDSLDGTLGTVSTTDVVQVATLSSVADVDALVAANIDAVA